MKKITLLLFFGFLFFISVKWIADRKEPIIIGKRLLPTEFDINKSKRKDFKISGKNIWQICTDLILMLIG